MNRLLFLFASCIFSGCSVAPEPIQYGSDACTTCKMIIVDERFGAEVVSTKGKAYKFDDVTCLVQFLTSGKLQKQQISKTLVIDYKQKNHFLDADQSVYVISDQLRTPMNGHAAAFESKQEALNLQNEKQGDFMDWKQVYDKLR